MSIELQHVALTEMRPLRIGPTEVLREVSLKSPPHLAVFSEKDSLRVSRGEVRRSLHGMSAVKYFNRAKSLNQLARFRCDSCLVFCLRAPRLEVCDGPGNEPCGCKRDHDDPENKKDEISEWSR